MNKGIIAIVIIAIVVIGAGVLLLKSPSSPSSRTPSRDTTSAEKIAPLPTPPAPTPIQGESPTPAATKEFTVTSQNFSFNPSTITVNKGDTVKITFKNSAGNHDFHIDEFNVATKVIGSGQSQTVEFIADKIGSFEYYCAIHRSMGMKGTLIVQ